MTGQELPSSKQCDEFEESARRTGKFLRAAVSGSLFLYLAVSQLYLRFDIWPPDLPDIRQSSNDLYAIFWTMGYDFFVLFLAICGYCVDKSRRRWFFWAICFSAVLMPLFGLCALKAYFR